MKFYDLQRAVERLALDPRVGPNTSIQVEMEQITGEITMEVSAEYAPLLNICLDDHTIILSSTRRDSAMAR